MQFRGELGIVNFKNLLVVLTYFSIQWIRSDEYDGDILVSNSEDPCKL